MEKKGVTSFSYLIPILTLVSCFAWAAPRHHAQEAKKPFTVADDVGLTYFGAQGQEVQFSPDGNYFVVSTERGRLDMNLVENSFRFYRSQDVKSFLEHSDRLQAPSPVWVAISKQKESRGADRWRWLADSSGVAFLEPTFFGNQRLMLADLRKKTVEPLTSELEPVGEFDVRDRQHYAYTVADNVWREKRQRERWEPAIVGTGHSLFELLFPDDLRFSAGNFFLRAVVGGKPFDVKYNGTPIVPLRDFALSPDGRTLVTTLPVPYVPLSWETLYPPPYASFPTRIHAGQDSASQYVRIDLQTGSVSALIDGPTSTAAGWFASFSRINWSSDGQAVLLPGAFLSSKDNVPRRPCVVVLDLPSNRRTCVEVLKGRTETGMEEGYHRIWDARFVGGDKRRVMVGFSDRDWSVGTTEYRSTTDGTWQLVEQAKGMPGKFGPTGLEVTVKQWLAEPPLLVGADKQASRVIWDPNPQLKDIERSQASVYTWKDKEGRSWKAGLYKPIDYREGQRYPLVIQTHGFTESEYVASGWGPPFAARELAATGMVVLQVGEAGECGISALNEDRCYASGYETVAHQLVSDGIVDPDKIGIIGFSRTCLYVMEMLTTRSLRLKAASITDGVMMDYFQFMQNPTRAASDYPIIGAPPFGEGLQQWLKRAPGFNLDKINTPLMVVGLGPVSLLNMWQPYAGLHYLHKPVDLIMLNTDEHVLTNPAVRMASQGGTVDWFRFWLQGNEDPDPAKQAQYVRWRELRKLQEQNEKNSSTPSSN